MELRWMRAFVAVPGAQLPAAAQRCRAQPASPTDRQPGAELQVRLWTGTTLGPAHRRRGRFPGAVPGGPASAVGQRRSPRSQRGHRRVRHGQRSASTRAFATDHLVSLVRVLRRDHAPPRARHRQLPPHSRRAQARLRTGDARPSGGRRARHRRRARDARDLLTRLGVLLRRHDPLAGAGIGAGARARRPTPDPRRIGRAWSIRRLVGTPSTERAVRRPTSRPCPTA